jgi:hypothetical protein
MTVTVRTGARFAAGFVVNWALCVGAIVLVAALDSWARSNIAAAGEDAALPWSQLGYGVAVLVMLSPIVVGLPLAAFSVILAVVPHPRVVAITVPATSGLVLALITVTAGSGGLREFALFGGMGFACGALLRLPPSDVRRVHADESAPAAPGA